MEQGIEDRDGHVATLEVDPVGSAVRIRGMAPTGGLTVTCTPARARQLAEALVRAADEAESRLSADPVTVKACDLRRGDVREGDRAMTVADVRSDGATVHVTWKSDAGRNWTQGYDAEADIALRRRG